MVQNRVVINPLDINLNEDANQLLHEYLTRHRSNGLLIKRDDKSLRVGMRYFSLTNDIYVEEVFAGKFRYHIIANDPLGVGSVGTAYLRDGVIHHSSRDPKLPLQVEPKRKRVYKLQTKRDAWQEYEIMKWLGVLRVRPMQPGIPSVLSMHEIEGESLIDVINDERTNRRMSKLMRYMLSVKILRELRFMHRRHVIHNDGSLRNFKFNRANCRLTLFDFGLSKFTSDHSDVRGRENPVYAAPEAFISAKTDEPITSDELEDEVAMKSLTTEKSDIYTIGRVLIALWRGKDPYLTDKSDLKTIKKKRAADGWKVTLDLFHQIDDLREDDELNEKVIITSILRSMLDIIPDNRMSLDLCLKKFLHLMLEEKIKQAPELIRGCILPAFYISQQALAELEEIEQISWVKQKIAEALSTLKYRHDISIAKCEGILLGKFAKLPRTLVARDLSALCKKLHINTSLSIQELFVRIDDMTNPERLVMSLRKHVELLKDDEYVISEFIEYIDQQCLLGVKSKAQLAEKLNSILFNYQAQQQALKLCIANTDASGNKMLRAELQHLQSKLIYSVVTLDELVYQANHLERKLQKLTEEYALKKIFAI